VLWAVLSFVVCQAALSLLRVRPPSQRFNEAELSGVPTLAESIVQWQVTNLQEDLGPVDVVFFGDSSCLMGVMPRIVGEDSGLRCWNFGTLGWLSTDGHADLLQLYVDRHGPPALAVYYVTTWPLTATRKDIEACGYLKRVREWLGADASIEDESWLERLPSTQARRWFQTFTTRGLVRSWERRRFLSSPRGGYPSDNAVHEMLKANRGFMAELPSANTEETWKAYAAKTTEEHARPRLSPDCIAGLQRMFALADARQFDLVVRLNPLPDAFRSPQTDQAFHQLEQDLHEVAAAYQRARIGTPFLRYYPSLQHSSVTHLSEVGAARNSHELARWLGDYRSTFQAAVQPKPSGRDASE
jgi:hypothetical protein